ncbi:MAG: VOC family protein [Nitrososphaeria archaeon]
MRDRMRHSICHVEFATGDVGKAGDFYRNVFGWDISHLHGSNYARFELGRDVSGGLVRSSTIIPPYTIVYISTDDIGKTLEKVKENGGKVVLEKTVVDPEAKGGWFAFFADLDDNLIGLYEPKV